jgi:hypothetical protein
MKTVLKGYCNKKTICVRVTIERIPCLKVATGTPLDTSLPWREYHVEITAT